MPMPKPKDGESHDEFMGRCMGDSMMNDEMPDEDQRAAACQSQWEDMHGKTMLPEDDETLFTRPEVPEEAQRKSTPLENFMARYPEGRVLSVNIEVKASNKNNREVLHVISSSSVDRAGDVVEPGGAGLTSYVKNPIVLEDHMYTRESIIGRNVSIEVDRNVIWARTRFRDNDKGRDGFALATEGLGGWSIGFKPITYEGIKDDKGQTRGFRFKQWELLEYSLVAVPMNQDAVNAIVQRGLVHPENVNLFFRVQQKQAEPVQPASPGTTAEPAEAAPDQRLAGLLAGWSSQNRTSRRIRALTEIGEYLRRTR